MENDQRLTSLMRNEVINSSSYQVEDASGLIKLDAMENPYTWPSHMIDDWLDKLRGCELNRYPDPSADELKSIIRRCNSIPESADLLLGNGSDELIQILLMAISGSESAVVAPEPTFVMYRQLARCMGIRYIGVPISPNDFTLNMDAMRDTIERTRPAIIFLAYPNNPTGNLFSEQDVSRILQLAPGIVVLDEAYAPFAGTSFMSRLESFDNLLVMRTLSKLGLAGLRLGYLAGPADWITQLNKLRLPYNINALTQISAEFALSHYRIFHSQTQQICKDRDVLFNQLDAIDGIKVYPSAANFLLFRLECAEGHQVFASLKKSGVLIKNLSTAGGPLSNCLRVTVGTPDENTTFLAAIRQILIS